MLASQRIESEENVDGVSNRFVGGGKSDFSSDTFFELYGDEFGRFGCILRRSGKLPHVIGRGRIGIFEDASLVGNVEEVFVCSSQCEGIFVQLV